MSTPAISINLNSVSWATTPTNQEQHLQVLRLVENIQRVANQKLSKMALLTIQYWAKSLTQLSYPVTAAKVGGLGACTSCLGLAVLTSYASGSILVNSDYSKWLTVSFANTFTNSGAFLACATDIPMLMWVGGRFVLGDAHLRAKWQIWKESYAICTKDDADLFLTPEMYEMLYREYILSLQLRGVEKYYLDPDTRSKTGAIYAELAPRLQVIDRKIDEGVKFRDVWKKCIKTFRQESCTKKIGKLTVVPPLLLMQALAVFLMIQNGILVVQTPLGDLFSSDINDQTNEAFYITQLGGLFASFTSFIVVTYLFHRLFFQTPLVEAELEKVMSSFEGQFEGLPADGEQHKALCQILSYRVQCLILRRHSL